MNTYLRLLKYLAEFLLRVRNVSDKTCRGNQNTFYVQQLFFSFENRALCEIMR